MRYQFGVMVIMLMEKPKNVDLISYLPLFIQRYREIEEIMKSENIILQDEWKNLKQAFKNNFIFQTDAYGISLFEKMMKIYPKSYDSLKDRQRKVYAKWNATIPYTWKWLVGYLDGYFLNTSTKATPVLFNNEYRLDIRLTNSDFFSSRDFELYYELRKLIPANLILNLLNILKALDGKLYFRNALICRMKKKIRADPINTVPTGKFWVNSGMVIKLKKGV